MSQDWKVDIDLGPITAALKAAGGRGLLKAGRHVEAESLKQVPVDTGELRDSSVVKMDGDTTVAIAYTDSKAVAAHENLHDTIQGGRKAKFLEQPLTSEPGKLADIIAAELRKETG